MWYEKAASKKNCTEKRASKCRLIWANNLLHAFSHRLLISVSLVRFSDTSFSIQNAISLSSTPSSFLLQKKKIIVAPFKQTKRLSCSCVETQLWIRWEKKKPHRAPHSKTLQAFSLMCIWAFFSSWTWLVPTKRTRKKVAERQIITNSTKKKTTHNNENKFILPH